MNLLGIDYGHKRIGLAYADTLLGVAVPIKAAVEHTLEDRLEHIALEITQRNIQKIIIGYPYNMDGTVGAKALEVDDFIKKLEKKFDLPIERFDERLSSHQAEQDYKIMNSYKSLSARKKHRNSGDIDSRAIALVLADYLENSQ